MRHGGDHYTVGQLRSTTVSTVSPGPKLQRTPHSRPSPVVAILSFFDLLLTSSRMKKTHTLDMFPYSWSTYLVALNLSLSNWSFSSIWSKIVGPPGWGIQKIEFQSVMPTGPKASARLFSMLSAIRLGILFDKLKMRPTSRSCAETLSPQSGMIVSDVNMIWNMGRSTCLIGSAPIITERAPSLKIACPTREPRSFSDGPRNSPKMLSAQTARTRALLLSARSLAIRRDVPPAKQPVSSYRYRTRN